MKKVGPPPILEGTKLPRVSYNARRKEWMLEILTLSNGLFSPQIHSYHPTQGAAEIRGREVVPPLLGQATYDDEEAWEGEWEDEPD